LFEIFTDAAKRSLVLGQDEAIALGHDFIGTEHLLLGLVGVPDGLAGQVLAESGVTADRARTEAVGMLAAAGVTGASSRGPVEALAAIGIDVEEIRQRADETFGPGEFQFPRPAYTTEAKNAIERSVSEAQSLGHDYVGTEHLLLGLLATGEGIGVAILSAVGADLDSLRAGVLARVAGKAW
jgi:ATP-dependent Clp protease ATP-binding subunit ClpA